MLPDDVVRPADQVVYRDLDEGGVLLHLGSGQYHGLNPMGSLTWGLIDGRRTVAEVLAAVRARAPRAPERLEDDVQGFLAGMRDRGLIAS